MSKAIALTAVQTNSFKAAYDSLKNCSAFLANLMYGTPERVRITMALAFALIALGYSLQVSEMNILPVCAK